MNFGTSQTGLRIEGDVNFVAGMPDATTVGTIGGGNDTIRILDSAVSTTGGQSNGSFVDIRGRGLQARRSRTGRQPAASSAAATTGSTS